MYDINLLTLPFQYQDYENDHHNSTSAITIAMQTVIIMVPDVWADIKAATNNALRQTMQILEQFTSLISVWQFEYMFVWDCVTEVYYGTLIALNVSLVTRII